MPSSLDEYRRVQGSPWWTSVSFATDAGCWQWTASVDGKGYGNLRIAYKLVKVHRLVWEALRGPIPLGLELDHLCRNKGCCNPAHLEPVTRSENMRRSDVGLRNKTRGAAVTHCPAGHAYDDSNTIYSSHGRHCRECGRKRAREYQRTKRNGKVQC